MGDDEQGDVVLGAGAREQIDHLILVGGVDARRGLIGEDHPRPVGERPGHGHPLLLADREFARLVIEPVRESDRRQQVGGPPAVGLASAERHRHQHVLQCRESG